MSTETLAAVVIEPQRIFILLFLMLGPVKLLLPFVEMTRQSDPALRRVLANRAIIFSAAALLLAGAIGDKMVANLGIPLPILAVAGGLILFIVALNAILEQFVAPALAKLEGAPRDLHALTARLAFPTIVTPSGVAAIIVFCALAKNDVRMLLEIGGITVGILLLDWLAMLFAEPILRWGRVVLQLFAVILGVIQVSLGLQLMLRGLSLSGVLPVTQVSAAAEGKEYDLAMPMLSADGKFDGKSFDVMAQSVVDLKILDHKPDLTKLVTEKYLPSA